MSRIIFILGTTFFFVSCTHRTYPETSGGSTVNTSVEAKNENSGRDVTENKVNMSESVSSLESENENNGEHMLKATTNSDQ